MFQMWDEVHANASMPGYKQLRMSVIEDDENAEEGTVGDKEEKEIIVEELECSVMECYRAATDDEIT